MLVKTVLAGGLCFFEVCFGIDVESLVVLIVLAVNDGYRFGVLVKNEMTRVELVVKPQLLCGLVVKQAIDVTRIERFGQHIEKVQVKTRLRAL